MASAELNKELNRLIHHLEDGGSEEEDVTLGEVLGSFDQRSFGPLLLVPAGIAVTPLGGLPGMSFVTGAMIFLISGQMLLGRTQPWLPRFLKNMKMPRQRVIDVSERAKPWTKKVSRFLSQRWTSLLSVTSLRFLAVSCLVLAVLFYPLALVPFAVAIPALAVLFFALGLVAKDGLFIAAGYLATLGTIGLSLTLLV